MSDLSVTCECGQTMSVLRKTIVEQPRGSRPGITQFYFGCRCNSKAHVMFEMVAGAPGKTEPGDYFDDSEVNAQWKVFDPRAVTPADETRTMMRLDTVGFGCDFKKVGRYDNPCQETKRWPLFPVGATVRVLGAVNGYVMSCDGVHGLAGGTTWEVVGNFVPADGTEPSISIGLHSGAKAFLVSKFEQVAPDVNGKLVPCLVQHWTSPRGDEGVVSIYQDFRSKRPIHEIAMNIRARVDAAVGHMSMVDVQALRERAALTGATLPVTLESTEPVNDWSTSFDENYDDHQPRNRKL